MEEEMGEKNITPTAREQGTRTKQAQAQAQPSK